MNHGVGAARFTSCMAAMPCGLGRRESAVITNTEKAKNTPPTTPLPTAETAVSGTSDRSIVASDRPHAGGGGVAGVVREVSGLAAQRLAHTVGNLGVAPIEDAGEQLGERPDLLGGHAVPAGRRRVLAWRDRQVHDLPV